MPAATEQATGASPNGSTLPKTLYAALKPLCRDVEEVKRDYPTTALVSTVLGAMPNTFPVGLLFPGAFTAVSLLPRTMLDVPSILLSRGGNMPTAAIAGYAASERASCTYCELHCCTLMKRFGAPDSALAAASRTPAEAASAAHGAAIAALPSSVEDVAKAVAEVRKHLPEKDVEMQASFASMLGFMNTFNHILGIPTELDVALAVRPQLAAVGKTVSDEFVDRPMVEAKPEDAEFRAGGTWGFALKVLTTVPAAVLYTVRALWGIPGDKNGARAFLVERLGASLSVLEDAASDDLRRALVLALRDNLAGDECKFPRALKYALGLAFAKAARNDLLAGNMQTLLAIEQQKGVEGATVPEGLAETLLCVSKDAEGCGADWCQTVMEKLRPEKSLKERDVCAIMLCMTTFAQPIRTGEAITGALLKELEGAEIVEVVSWMAILVLINRMMLFRAAVKSN